MSIYVNYIHHELALEDTHYKMSKSKMGVKIDPN